jgi:riboflavin-specific deaminase-like protein
MNRKNLKLPFVFSNFAITADGKIAFASREFVPFGSKHDHDHMMELRATADAIMAGARTVEAPGLTMGPGGRKYQRLRVARGLAEYNLRVIVTGSGSMNLQADIFKHRFSPIIFLVSERVAEKRLRELRGVADEVGVFGKIEVDLPAALRWLREKWKVKRLLCEGGAALHDSVVRSGLLAELHLTICPKIFGGNTAPTIAEGGDIVKLADAKKFTFTSAKRMGNELFAVFKAAKTGAF